MKIGNKQKLRYFPCMVMIIKFHNFKIFSPLLHGYISHNFKALLSVLQFSHSTISKFYQPFTIKIFFRLVTSLFIMSIIITIVSNITELVLQNIIFSESFIAISSPHLPLSYYVLSKFICCFTKKCLIKLPLLSSGYLQKIMNFQRK